MEEEIKIDRSKWHKPSYLGHYDENATHYEGLRTHCRKCGESFVVSAKEQKQEFEVEKRYPRWLPTLCPICSERWKALEKEALESQHYWESNRNLLALDREFLRKWLALLRESRLYGKKHFESRIRMLVKTIESLELTCAHRT
jgi:hypothetical protein